MNRKQFLKKYSHLDNEEFYEKWGEEMPDDIVSKDAMRRAKSRYLKGNLKEVSGKTERSNTPSYL